MFIIGVLIFSAGVALASYVASKPQYLDRGKVATSTTLIAWASMIAGLLLSKAIQ